MHQMCFIANVSSPRVSIIAVQKMQNCQQPGLTRLSLRWGTHSIAIDRRGKFSPYFGLANNCSVPFQRKAADETKGDAKGKYCYCVSFQLFQYTL
jgi:hypothetical protein